MTADSGLLTPSLLLRPFRTRILFLLSVVAVNAVLAVVPAMLGQRLIDEGVLEHDLWRIGILGSALVAVGILAAGTTLVERRLRLSLGEGVVATLRVDLFDHLQRQSAGFFAASRTGAVVARLHGDVQGIRNVIHRTLPTVASALMTLVFAGTAIILIEWRVALAVLLLAPVVYGLTMVFGRAQRPLAQQALVATADLDAMAAERLSPGGAEIIRLFGDRDREVDHFRGRAHRLRDVSVRAGMIEARLGVSLTLLIALVTAAVYVVGGLLTTVGHMSVGGLVAMIALIAGVYGPITALPGAKLELVAGKVSFERIQEVLDFPPAVTEQPRARPVHGSSVTFSDVGFSYPPRESSVLASLSVETEEGAMAARGGRARVLDGMSFSVRAGTTVGIVGRSGTGKSTIARLLTRSWDVDSGRIEIGGQDVRAVTLSSLRQAVGVVTQDIFLFNDTVRANLLLASPRADEDEIVRACRTAQLWDVIKKLPDGLDTVLGDRGVHLSGGERQRLAIARLILKAPEIVVLDEATAHLDTVTEKAIQKALRPFLEGRTCLVIAHRLSTIRDADQILVVDDGRLAEQGTHDGLMRRGGLYSRLVREADDADLGRGAIDGCHRCLHTHGEPVSRGA
ncbi:ABC transporter ATP-binding protein [Sphaerimonospora thailandensis]|uniref:ABC transporter ATP-binding protein n=1 Tax=Sphaerimonospora thailandensis TaxID=795644 RepID=A0A8J3R625_9ACTN|nr:ABC transporter ATP-binding protein [Sphaerimonospora thailandensis]